MTFNGSSFCGDIKYTIKSKLRNAVSCHGSMRRKTFSSQASALTFFKPDEFSLLGDKSLLTHYKADANFSVRFCQKCGTTLGDTDQGKLCRVTLGCVQGDPYIELGKHIFVGSKAAWETIAGDAPQYGAWPPENP